MKPATAFNLVGCLQSDGKQGGQQKQHGEDHVVPTKRNLNVSMFEAWKANSVSWDSLPSLRGGGKEENCRRCCDHLLKLNSEIVPLKRRKRDGTAYNAILYKNSVTRNTISPSTYLCLSLQNHKVKERIETFSLEQALYFEPYQESDIDVELLRALRMKDLSRIQIYDGETLREARNQHGENLAHLGCRMGVSEPMLRFLVVERSISLNVRDRYGRSPLHNACMLAAPDFEIIEFLLEQAPRLLLFEDEFGKTPFECIPQRCFDRWTRFLSEQQILKRVSCDLAKLATL
jgi:hypothetical protein